MNFELLKELELITISKSTKKNIKFAELIVYKEVSDKSITYAKVAPEYTIIDILMLDILYLPEIDNSGSK